VARPAYQVDGARQLRRDLKRAGREVTDLKAVHRDVAELVIAAADVPVRTGQLRRALKPVGTAASALVRGGARAVPYGNPIHWGWARRGIAPNPFLLDAADRRRGEIEDRYLTGLDKIIDKIEGDRRRL
jgi:hypothetical protein